jgi:hypothetical protein
MATIIVKNVGGVSKDWAGVTFPPASQYTLQAIDRNKFPSDDLFLADLTAGTAVVNNGSIDLPAVQGAELIEGTAREHWFDNSTNGFVSHEVQSAIEEAKAFSATASTRFFYADQLDSPNNSNWAVNANAPASSDSANPALLVRRFDDTAVEGVGFSLFVPAGTTNLIFYFKSRAQTAPATAKQVILRLYNRQIPNNAAITAWSSPLQITAIDIPANAFFQYDAIPVSMIVLQATAGRTIQFELTRFGSNAADTLVGDWNLLELAVGMS